MWPSATESGEKDRIQNWPNFSLVNPSGQTNGALLWHCPQSWPWADTSKTWYTDRAGVFRHQRYQCYFCCNPSPLSMMLGVVATEQGPVKKRKRKKKGGVKEVKEKRRRRRRRKIEGECKEERQSHLFILCLTFSNFSVILTSLYSP